MRVAAVAFGLLLLVGSRAGAVVVFNGTAPHVYAVTYVNEDWTQRPEFMGLSGFFDNTEQLEGSDSIASSQVAGIDAVPNPSCSPPCTGQTAEASASYVDGAIELSASSHAYGNFDDIVVLGDPPDQTYLGAYYDGNFVRAETDAAVFDRLTLTAPVQLDLQGHIAGDMFNSIASDSQIYQAEIPDAYFGSGTVSGALIISLRSTPIEHTVVNLVTLNKTSFSDVPTVVDEDVIASTPVLTAGDYILRADLRTITRMGTVNGPNLAVQDMRADFGHTASLRFIASDPSAVTAASGLLTFTAPEAGAEEIGATALIALGAAARRRR